MRRRFALAVLAATAALAASACHSPATPDDPVLVVDLAPVESVSARIAESFPVQVFARVQGYLPDGCSTLLPIRQARDGNRITLTVQKQRPKDASCIMVIKPFDESVRLEGSFPPGSYEVQANDVKATFKVD